MIDIDLEALREPRGYPSVSVLSPLQRHRPGNAEDPLRLRHLAEVAEQRLRDEAGAYDRAAVVEHLTQGIRAVDLRNPSEGVAIFATPSETLVLALPFAVRERVVIDDAFETRDLARGLARLPRYRMIVLGEKPTRLLDTDGDALVEIRAFGFPMSIEGAVGETLESGGYPPHSSRSGPQIEDFFRRADRALGAHATADPRPLIVAGVDRDLAYFEHVTTHAAWIIGHVPGNHELSPPERLADLGRPIAAEHLADRRSAAVAELAEAIGGGRAVVGIKPVWRRAMEGRGRVLLVEDAFEYPARIVDGTLEPASEPDAPEILDDAVDALIDVVTEAGGDVLFFERDALGIHGPIALLLRY
jgi:hypothetical protein